MQGLIVQDIMRDIIKKVCIKIVVVTSIVVPNGFIERLRNVILMIVGANNGAMIKAFQWWMNLCVTE